MPRQIPTADEVFAKFEKPEVKPAAPAPPRKSDDRSASQVLKDQLKQVPEGVADVGRSMSPVRFREGWTHPTFEIPEAARNAAQMAGHAATGNASGLMHDVAPMFKPLQTAAQGAGALAESFQLARPGSFPAPSPEEFQAATRGATQTAAGLIAADTPAMVGRAQMAATRAGIPGALVRAGTAADGLPWYRHPAVSIAGPALRGAGRMLFNPEALPPLPINGQIMGDPYVVPGDAIDVTPIQRPSPPAPPPMQGRLPAGGGGPRQITGQVADPRALPESPVKMTPPGTEGAPLPPSPALPSWYNSADVRGPVAGPGVFGAQGLGDVFGEEGGIQQTGEQTPYPVKADPVKQPGPYKKGHGPYRKGTPEDLPVQKGNVGRTVREPEKPTPPKKRAASKKG